MMNDHLNSSKVSEQANQLTAPTQICKFEELKGEFFVRREIGRGKFK